MSKWMALLKERKNSFTLSLEPTEPTKGGSVGFVGSSLREIEKIDVPDTETHKNDAHVSDWVDWNERAAIMEYDGGLTRAEAERSAE
jgi:translation elongation factor EF-4